MELSRPSYSSSSNMASEAHQSRCAALADVFSSACTCSISNQLRKLLSNFLELESPPALCGSNSGAAAKSRSGPMECTLIEISDSDGEDPSPGASTEGEGDSGQAIEIDDSFDVEIIESSPCYDCDDEFGDNQASPSLQLIGVDKSVEALFKQHLVDDNLHNLQMKYRNRHAARKMPPEHRAMLTTMSHPFGPCTWYVYPDKREAIVHFMSADDAYEALSFLRSHLPAAIVRFGPNQAPHWSVLAADTCGRAPQ